MDVSASSLKESLRKLTPDASPQSAPWATRCVVEADIFTDGHDSISASLLAHREGSDEWTEIPMRPLVNDRWTASFRVGELGRYGFKVQGWVDHFETWRRDLLKRIKAESDAAVDYLIGADLIAEAAARAAGADADWLSSAPRFCVPERNTKHYASTPPIPRCTIWSLPLPRQAFRDGIRSRTQHRCRSGACPIQRVVRVLSPLHRTRTRQARHLRRLRKALAIRFGDGLQRCLSAAHSSHRRHLSQGTATTHPKPSRAISAVPGLSAPQRAATRAFIH